MTTEFERIERKLADIMRELKDMREILSALTFECERERHQRREIK
jgi:hypothetical protein